LFSEEEYIVDLYCHESMSNIFKAPAIMLNEKDKEISRITDEVKLIFHKMKQNQEYDFISKKRDAIISAMIQMCHERRRNHTSFCDFLCFSDGLDPQSKLFF